MKTTLAWLMFLLASCAKNTDDTNNPIDDDLAGPISRPTTGYGKDGTLSVAKVSFPSPLYAGKNVDIFYPEGTNTARPTIFYSHAFGGEDSEYCKGLFEFIAKKGYVVVFAPYPTIGASVEERYSTLWTSFKKAQTDYPNLIETKQIGFMGHSFGGGASIGLGYKGFVEEGWGQNGRFIFSLAPWYSFQITPTQLQSFPANTKLLMQVYDDDDTNDHRIAIDIFKNINVTNAEKDFVYMGKSVLPTYTYVADHVVPNTRSAYDAYDYYGIYRLLDALIDYSFNNSAAAKNVALGNGSAEQTTMPSYNGQALAPLEVTDDPVPAYSQSKYEFSCSNPTNPRTAYCP